MAGPITGDAVLALLVDVGSEPAKSMKPDSNFVDAGVDSFDVMKMLDKIEETWSAKIDITEVYSLGNCDKTAAKLLEVQAKPSGATPTPTQVQGGDATLASSGNTNTDTDVVKLFEKLGLAEYTEAFIEDGWDDSDIIKGMEQGEFDELCLDTAKMKKGHHKKLQMWKDGKWNGS